MTLTITAEQRDALYDQIFERLSGIGDVWLAVRAESFETAARLGQAYSDDLRLVTDDLGWGEGSGEAIELSTPPDVLRRALSRMRDAAINLDGVQRKERLQLRQSTQRNDLVLEACRKVLSDLDLERDS
jgi:hypothetical protein